MTSTSNKAFSTLALVLLAAISFAQTSISGFVKNKQGEALPGANIFIKNTYDGASSDSEGEFRFQTSETGTQTLMVTMIGYQTWQKEIDVTSEKFIEIIMHESVNSLDAVTITAGSFTADDEGRASVMKPLDIYTTPSANGDVMAAIRTMPGTQAAADDGRLLVRGGDVYESSTYIDGLIASNPYNSKTPDIPSRGRFAPSLFSGVQFNTGGYSAEYGQALSSVLILNSSGVAEQNNTGISLMSLGAEATHTASYDNSSLMFTGAYSNFKAYDKIFNSNIDWVKPIESIRGTAVYRYKPRSSGLFKAYATADLSDLSYNLPINENETMLLSNRAKNAYSNFSYRDCYSENSCYKIGVSSSYQNTALKLGNKHVNTQEWNIETRVSLVHSLSEGIQLNWGINETSHLYHQDYIEHEGATLTGKFNDHLLGGFVESEIKFTKNLAIRPGIRSEYSSAIDKASLQPRFAVALKTGKNAQLSGAWGIYHQTPQADYLKLNTSLKFEKAMHYILSYQAGKLSERLFRIETYYKQYSNLITFSEDINNLPKNIANTGNGYAGGFDLFWRDQKTIKRFDYWITYSFIDTQRKYKDYPVKATPNFVSKHTLSTVGKYWLSRISTQVGASYTLASGRPYNDPNSAVFNGAQTKMYSDLSLNFSHIFYIGDQYSVLYCSVNNVLGNDNVLSYRTSQSPNARGNYTLIPVKREMKRMMMIGLFLNF